MSAPVAARLPADAITHTPGPWRVLHRTGVFPADSDCYSIGTAEQHRKEAGANAALMAAAPDLLAALESVTGSYRAYRLAEGDDDTSDSIKEAEAAIAATAGGAP